VDEVVAINTGDENVTETVVEIAPSPMFFFIELIC
jgi:hypothetical protein